MHTETGIARFVPLVIILAFVLFSGGCSKKGDMPSSSSGTEQKEDRESVASSRAKGSGETEKEELLREGVRKAKLVLETKEGKDVMSVVVLEKTREPGSVRFGYEWTVNGQPSGRENTLYGFKRGDKVSVRITPYEGEKAGRSRVLEAEIKNTTPKVVEIKHVPVDGDRLSFQAVASDADGDKVTFALVNPPGGMKINAQSGLIEWTPESDSKEDVTVTVKVTDGQGGELLYPFKVGMEKVSK